MEKLRQELAEIEKAIIAHSGDDIDSYALHLNDTELEILEELLTQRQAILNKMFQPTEEKMARFRAVNQRLYELTMGLYARMEKIEAKSHLFSDCPDFDDDYEIEGSVQFVFDSKKSILTLPDDEYYGSRFALMIKALYDFYEVKGMQNIESAYPYSTPLDDGVSWNEAPFANRPEFDDIIICHAVHDLTSHKAYSIPDLLRLDDFWSEVKITIQNFTDQKGTRYYGHGEQQ